MTKLISIVVLILLPSVQADAQSIRRCVDSQGNVVFTNLPSESGCAIYSSTSSSQGSTRQTSNKMALIGLNPPQKQVRPIVGITSKTPTSFPDFIDLGRNKLEAGSPAVLALFSIHWRMANESIRILHLGDSHVQNGFIGEVARRELQSVYGNGGRGIVFPYALARSNSQSDYQSTKEGNWQSGSSVRPLSGLPLGVTGVAARTTNLPAATTLKFPQSLPSGQKTVRIFLRSSKPGVLLTVSTTTERRSSKILQGNTLKVAEFIFNDSIASLRIDVSSPTPAAQFELHGISIDGPGKGIIYQSLGVNGATLSSLNEIAYLEDQLADLRPDIILLDFGSNELINSENALPARYEVAVSRVIQRIRKALPNVIIVLATPQDMNFQGRNVATGLDFSRLVRQIALEQGCLLWDWYQISGGAGSMRQWSARGLANRDNVHLLPKGYQVKGAVLAKAFLGRLNPSPLPE